MKVFNTKGLIGFYGLKKIWNELSDNTKTKVNELYGEDIAVGKVNKPELLKAAVLNLIASCEEEYFLKEDLYQFAIEEASENFSHIDLHNSYQSLWELYKKQGLENEETKELYLTKLRQDTLIYQLFKEEYKELNKKAFNGDYPAFEELVSFLSDDNESQVAQNLAQSAIQWVAPNQEFFVNFLKKAN